MLVLLLFVQSFSLGLGAHKSNLFHATDVKRKASYFVTRLQNIFSIDIFKNQLKEAADGNHIKKQEENPINPITNEIVEDSNLNESNSIKRTINNIKNYIKASFNDLTIQRELVNDEKAESLKSEVVRLAEDSELSEEEEGDDDSEFSDNYVDESDSSFTDPDSSEESLPKIESSTCDESSMYDESSNVDTSTEIDSSTEISTSTITRPTIEDEDPEPTISFFGVPWNELVQMATVVTVALVLALIGLVCYRIFCHQRPLRQDNVLTLMEHGDDAGLLLEEPAEDL